MADLNKISMDYLAILDELEQREADLVSAIAADLTNIITHLENNC